MENKKTQKKRAFFAAMAMLLVSAIVITTASFAWFILGKTAAVDQLDIKIMSEGEGISISANTQQFTDLLVKEDLYGTSSNKWVHNESNVNNFPAVLCPMSSDFAPNAAINFFKGTIGLVYNDETNNTTTDEQYALTSVAVDPSTEVDIKSANGNESEVGYYAFDVYINYEGTAAAELKLGQSSVAVKEGAQEGSMDTVKAMRIGFVNYGTVTSATGGSVGETVIVNGKDSDLSSTLPVKSAGTSDTFGRNIYTVAAGKAGNISLGNSYGATKTCGEGQTANATTTIQPGVNRFRVYIWMEGQDELCTNELMSDEVTAKLVFEMV